RFIPHGERRTLAELSPAEKNRLSHRRRALEGLRPVLRALASGDDEDLPGHPHLLR
ncbi:MAG: hypothetical protein N2320_06275, partial [Candidatus Bipolaricaulota bacterium]|nr:hypothetical protein [Candidatus Bipolaricaulota bacterium]